MSAKPRTSSVPTEAEAPKLGHVLLCEACAERVGLRESFLLLHGPRECEGCGAVVGHECKRVPVETDSGKTIQWPVFGPMIAPYREMWRNKMWPVAFGIAVQDFGGGHVHDWSPGFWAREHEGKTNFQREHCRCGAKRERWEDPA